MAAIPDLDQFLLSVLKGREREPRRYELRCHPDVYLALAEASDAADPAAEYAPPAGVVTGTSPLYGTAAVTVRPDLGSGGWELYADGELLNSGRLGE